MLLLSQAVGLVIAGLVVVVAGEPLTTDSGTLAWVGFSGVLDLGGLWALYRGLARGSMSVVALLAATAAIIPAVYGLTIGEEPSALALSGVGLAVIGARSPGGLGTPGTRARSLGWARPRRRAVLRFGFVTLDTASEGSVVWTLLANRLGSVVSCPWLATRRD